MHHIIYFIRRFQNWIAAILFFSIILILFRIYPHQKLSENFLTSTAFYDVNGELLRLTLANDEKYRLWTPLEKISPVLIDAIKLHEDQWFEYHFGFNPFSLARGAWVSYIKKGNKQGGSTLTMQLARMHWNLNTKNVSGKAIQILRAVQLELFYSKKDILEAYLNYAPYGRNIESIGAATLIYFNKQADQINLQEALSLAVLPQSPTYRINKNTQVVEGNLLNARDNLYTKWKKKYKTDVLDDALFSMPLVLKQPEKLPFKAPHFIEQIIFERKKYAIKTQNVFTTLDLSFQTSMEKQIENFIKRESIKGIKNASAILIDTRNMQVKALIGSADYFNSSIYGQVNGTLAKRSPGSTLKPFIYALGFDQGLIHPMSILKDSPSEFGSYAPENFDLKFKGPINVTDALNYSRNIPAVYISSKLKNPNLYQFLKTAGIGRMASQGHYGLALSLGGGEVSMQELAKLYSMLSNNGILKELVFECEKEKCIQTEENKNNLKLLSEESTFMTLDMLSKNLRPKMSMSEKKPRLKIYWKTGTSWGFRDAWSAGIFGPYVLIVWEGNFDGKGNPALTGQGSAAPLFFQIIDNLLLEFPNINETKRDIPKNIKKVNICLSSGNLLTKWCEQKGTTWFIPGKTPIKVDDVFRPVYIDIFTNKVACYPYDENRTKIEVYEFWSSDLLEIYKQAGIPKKMAPSSAHCKNLNIGLDKVKITSPSSYVTYKIEKYSKEKQSISLNATSLNNSKYIYWFVNKTYIGSSKPSNSLEWNPENKGTYTISAIDENGASDQKNISVEIIN